MWITLFFNLFQKNRHFPMIKIKNIFGITKIKTMYFNIIIKVNILFHVEHGKNSFFQYSQISHNN